MFSVINRILVVGSIVIILFALQQQDSKSHADTVSNTVSVACGINKITVSGTTTSPIPDAINKRYCVGVPITRVVSLDCDKNKYIDCGSSSSSSSSPCSALQSFTDKETQTCNYYNLPAVPPDNPINYDNLPQCLGEGAACGGPLNSGSISCCAGGTKNLQCKISSSAPAPYDGYCKPTACLDEGSPCTTSTTNQGEWCCYNNNAGNQMSCVDSSGKVLLPAFSNGSGSCKPVSTNCKPRGQSCSQSTDCCITSDYLWCKPGQGGGTGLCEPREIVSSPELKCACDSPGTGRGYTCSRNGTFISNRSCFRNEVCVMDKPDSSATFREDSGVWCNTVTSSAPPAPAPCTSRDSQGRCLSIDSSFGSFNTMPGEFVVKAFSIVLAASGAIAVLLIMRAGYKIMTARGNPEGLQQGREQLIAAIVGLMFLIFSFVFLQVIGVDLLQIPSFSGISIPLNGTCDVNNPKCEAPLVCKYNGAQGQCQNP